MSAIVNWILCDGEWKQMAWWGIAAPAAVRNVPLFAYPYRSVRQRDNTNKTITIIANSETRKRVRLTENINIYDNDNEIGCVN